MNPIETLAGPGLGTILGHDLGDTDPPVPARANFSFVDGDPELLVRGLESRRG